MIQRRVLSAAFALAMSAAALIVSATKTKDDIVAIEAKKKNRTYWIKKEEK